MSLVIAGICLLCLTQAQPGQSERGPQQRLRTDEAQVRVAIEEGRRGSPTFAALVELIDRSALFVYVARSPTLPRPMEGCLVPTPTNSGYLRILLARRLNPERLVVVLAHELQHVREVIEGGGQTDLASIEALFGRIGSPQRGSSTGEQYETAEAHRVMTIVARELRESVRSARQP